MMQMSKSAQSSAAKVPCTVFQIVKLVAASGMTRVSGCLSVE